MCSFKVKKTEHAALDGYLKCLNFGFRVFFTTALGFILFRALKQVAFLTVQGETLVPEEGTQAPKLGAVERHPGPVPPTLTSPLQGLAPAGQDLSLFLLCLWLLGGTRRGGLHIPHGAAAFGLHLGNSHPCPTRGSKTESPGGLR